MLRSPKVFAFQKTQEPEWVGSQVVVKSLNDGSDPVNLAKYHGFGD